MTNVNFFADKEEPSLVPQDRYDDDLELTLIADDEISDEGTASPTASPTMKTTQKATTDATEYTTASTDADDDPTDSPTISTTTEDTIEVTGALTTEDTFISDEGTDTSTSTDDGIERRILSSDDSVIDLVFFLEPSSCVKTKAGCNWTKLGVGASDNLGNIHWCCSEETVLSGICESSDLGRMIIKKTLFGGEHRPVLIPPTGDYSASVKLPVMNTKEGTGQYSLVLANCNDYGRSVLVKGDYIWKSKGGYLPGNLYDEWHFFTFFTLAYAGLLFWYGRSMSQNRDSIIGIQKWILCTVVLALIELVFKGVDYMEWNHQGTRVDAVMYFCEYSYPYRYPYPIKLSLQILLLS